MNTKKLLVAAAMLLMGAAGALAQTHVASNKNGVPGMKVSLNSARIRHSGDEIVLYPVFQQTGAKEIGLLSLDNNRYAWVDDEEPIDTYMPETQVNVPSDGEPVANYMEMRNVPLNAKAFSKLKIVGRAPNSQKSTPNNYYGDFDYVFTDVPIPQFHSVAPDAASGKPGGMFTDNEVQLGIVSAEKSNGNLYVTFTLANVGKSNKNIEAKDGYATTSEGDRLPTAVKIPNSLESGEMVKGVLAVEGGANEDILSIKHNFYVIEGKSYWHPQLIIK